MQHSVLKYSFFVVILFSIVACDFFKSQQPLDAVVSLDNHYLTKTDIEQWLPESYTTADSLRIVNAQIDRWAIDHLLMKNAALNISKDEQDELNQLVANYKQELYTQVYKENLTKQNLDTIIRADAIKKYYETQLENLKLNEDLVQLSFVELDPLYSEINVIKKLLNKHDSVAVRKLDSLSLGFKSYYVNDSIWVKKSRVFEKIPYINVTNEKSYINDASFHELQDSLSLYLVRFHKVLRRGEKAPLQYLKPTIKQILLNKRKLNYIKNLEKELLNDAVQSNKLKY